MVSAQQPTSSSMLYKELQVLQERRLPTQTLDCAQRLTAQALHEGNLNYTIKGLEAHQNALYRLDYNRRLEQFALLHKAWQGRTQLGQREQRFLALYIARQYLSRSTDYDFRSEGLVSHASEPDTITPRYWSDSDYMRAITPLLETAFAPSKSLYTVLSEEETKQLPDELYQRGRLDEGRYTLLSHLLQAISLEQIQRLEQRLGNKTPWCDRIQALLDDQSLRQIGDEGAKLYATYQAVMLTSELQGIKSQTAAKRLEEALELSGGKHVEAKEVYKQLAYYYIEQDKKMQAYQLLMPYLEWLEQQYPKSKWSREFIEEMQRLLFAPQVSCSVPSFVLAEHPKSIHYQMANVKKLSLRLYALTPQSAIKGGEGVPSQARLVWSQEIDGATGPESILLKRDSIELPILPVGHYRLQTRADFTEPAQKATNSKSLLTGAYNLTVSNLMILSLEDSKKQLLDALTGEAMREPVRLFGANYRRDNVKLDNLGEQQPDKLGFVQTPLIDYSSGYDRIFIESADKNLLLPIGYSYGYNATDPIATAPQPLHTMLLQTDRSLYQPGEEVQLYIVAYRITGYPSEASVLANKKLTVKLMTPQGDRVDSLVVTTNVWGRVRASLQLPKDAMTGSYRIIVSSSNDQEPIETQHSYIEVAEYQRPNYVVSLEMPEVAMPLGQTITASGSAKTYSGYPLSRATVTYSIMGTYRNWWLDDDIEPQLLSSGSLTVDEQDGSFALPITLTDLRTEAMRESDNSWALHTYQIELVVTAPSGETQRLERTLWIGNRPIEMEYEGGETFFKDKDASEQPLTIRVTNDDEAPIKTTIQLRLTSQADSTRSWSHEIEANEEQYLPTEWLKLPSGLYRLTFIYQSPEGNKLEEEREITLFAEQDKSLQHNYTLWCASPSHLYPRGGSPTIYYSSSEEQQTIYYIIKVADQPALYGTLPTLSKHRVGQWRPTLPESIDPDGQLQIQLYAVRDGVYSHKDLRYRYIPEQPTLQISWIEMPDKLLAGASHTWQAHLTYSDGTPARRIPVMAWMYDAALESLRPHHISHLSQYRAMSLRTRSPEPLFSFNQTNDFFYEHPLRSFGRAGGYPAMMEMAKAESIEDNSLGMPLDDMAADAAPASQESSNMTTKESHVTPDLRTDFSQTAFFLTDLYTDDEGVVTFTGQMPESLSRFRLCLFGYDSRLIDSDTTQDIETYRELMVETLRPRFFMQGDQAYLTGAVRNLTEATLTGTLQVKLYDALSDSTSAPIAGGALQMALTIPADGVTPYAVPLPALPALDALRVQVYFVSNRLSDGEEYIIPLQPATVRTVESIPFAWDKQATYEYRLSDLLGNASDESGALHLQLWSNPRYFALQQLPILFNNDERDAINTLLRIYTLTRTQRLLRQPDIAQWVKEQAQATDGANKLTSNRETLLLPLEQTPWRATEQWLDGAQEQLWELFNTSDTRTTAKDIAQLSNLQTASGDWSWYPDMPSSSHLTPLILDYLSAVDELEPNKQIQAMCQAGWRAYDETTTQRMEEMKKQLAKSKLKPSLPAWGAEWLYLSLRWRGDKALQSNKTTKALLDYLTPLLVKEAEKLPLYALPQAAYTLDKLGKGTQARQLAEILHDHLSYEPAQGAFFANTTIGGYFWRDRSMSLQRETIALFEMLRLYPETVQQMRRWAMEYLRTNLRASNLSQMELLLTLLDDSSSAQPVSTDQVTISIPLADGTTERIVTDSYCGLQYKPSELDRAGSIVVTHSDPTALLWGGILSISTRPLATVPERQGELMIETETFVREEVNGQIVERPIAPDEELAVGTILTTRLRITSRRDLDFVTIRDMRPACCEPLEQLSRYQWQSGLGYYVEARSTAQIYHIDNLLRGSYELSYEQSVVRPGVYQRGITQAQCAYATEYSAQTAAPSPYIVTSHD